MSRASVSVPFTFLLPARHPAAPNCAQAVPVKFLQRRSRTDLLVTGVIVAAIAAGVTGCSPDPTPAPAPSPSTATVAVPDGVEDLGFGFLNGTTPTPEATVNPEAGSWDGVEPPAGYQVVLISTGDDSATSTLVSAVTAWADDQGVELVALPAANADDIANQIDAAVTLAPDLVVGAGSGIVDVFALATPQHLGQQFLAIGAELAEPTENTTAVVWDGATFRGTGLSGEDERDPKAVTPARAHDAIEAGVASVLHGVTGVVLHLTF